MGNIVGDIIVLIDVVCDMLCLMIDQLGLGVVLFCICVGELFVEDCCDEVVLLQFYCKYFVDK